MSFDVNWDIDKYKEDHESGEQWMLRRNFMERWKSRYPEDRLVCLARVFANIEFMGCRYPNEVMLEVAQMSKEVAIEYRANKKTKLQRTFVSASDAAEDRARGVKREGGVITEGPQRKTNKVLFVRPGHVNETEAKSDEETKEKEDEINTKEVGESKNEGDSNKDEDSITEAEGSTELKKEVIEVDRVNYLAEFSQMKCLDLRKFRPSMFDTRFGKLVLMVFCWAGKLWNIQASCQNCRIKIDNKFDNTTGIFSLIINGIILAESGGRTKQTAKKKAGHIAWDIIKQEAILVLVKEHYIAHNDTRISVSEVSGKARPADDMFGTPVETNIASKMMKLMGWKGGGLGIDAQGIEEPVKPHLQMVNRAGLGSMSSDIRQIRRAAEALMRRYKASDCFDVDLVFSNDFSKEERAALHVVAKKSQLSSTSYGRESERFLVVKKKLDPFSLVKELIERGGTTPKYQVFIPATLDRR